MKMRRKTRSDGARGSQVAKLPVQTATHPYKVCPPKEGWKHQRELPPPAAGSHTSWAWRSTLLSKHSERGSSANIVHPRSYTHEITKYEPEMGSRCQPSSCMQDAGHILSVPAVPAGDGHAGVTACAHEKPQATLQ